MSRDVGWSAVADVAPPPATRRALEFLRAKRNLPLTWRSYGHWWLELDEDESYGWWPTGSVGLASTIRGTAGVLNGLGSTAGGTETRDPNHGLSSALRVRTRPDRPPQRR